MVGSRLLGEDGVSREFDKEMATKMLSGLDLIASISNGPDTYLMVEQWVDLSPWLGEGEGGTSDVFVIDVQRKKLTVFDWKWGAGVPVNPKWNDQGILYLLGVWHTFARQIFEKHGIGSDEIEVDIIIEQPRAPGGGGIWTVQLQTLLAEGSHIKKDADLTREPDAPYNPGSNQCKFCTAASNNVCKARTNMLVGLLGDALDEEDAGARVEAHDKLDLVDRRTLTPEQRSLVVLNTKLITGWLTQLYEEAMDDATKGRPVPGMKRVAGRAGRRKWCDEDKAERIIVDTLGEGDAYKKTLLSPAMVEDEVGKTVYREKFARLAEQAEPSPSLVPEDDPKPALVSVVEMIDAAWDEPDETENLI